MRRGTHSISWGLALVMGLGFVLPTQAQLLEDYRFKGRVLDPAGKPIAQAQITFRNVETGKRIVFKTENDGTFDRRMIPHAIYEVRFEKTGYVPRDEIFDWSVSTPEPILKEAQIVLESEAERARKELGKKAAELYEESYAALAEGDCMKAHKKATELLAIGAGTYEYAIHFVIARCRAIGNDLDAAAAEYQKVLALKPNLFEAHFDLALVLEKLAQHEKALLEYEKAGALHPEDPEVPYNMGAILFQQNQFDRARPYFEKTIELDSTHAQAMKGLGFAHLQGETKDFEAAARCLSDYLEHQPEANDSAQIREILDALVSAGAGPK